MYQRFVSKYFWNLYDSLGTFTLLSGVFGVMLMSIFLLAAFLLKNAGGAVIVGLVFLATLILLIALSFSVNDSYTSHSLAREKVPIKLCFTDISRRMKYYVLLLLAFLTITIGAVYGIRFYAHYAVSMLSSSPIFAVLLIICFYCYTFLYVFFMIVLLATLQYSNDKGLLARFWINTKTICVWPLFWLGVFLTVLGIVFLLTISIVGIMFIPVILISASHVSIKIVSTQVEYLQAAYNENELTGQFQSIRSIKRKAELLAMDEYMRTKRSFREILKPWE